MKTNTHLTAVKTAFVITALALTTTAGSSAPVLDGVSYDPGFITAGDRVNISANMHEPNYPDKIWDEDKQLKVVLEPGNRLTREYVTIEDDRDTSIGFLYPEGVWNQRFQVKTDSGAPTGMYDFKMKIQYLENGEPVEIPSDSGSVYSVIREFSMPVDREGVDMSANVVKTDPETPRPGDSYTELPVQYTNTGNKPVEEVTIKPETPDRINPAYSEDEKFFINRLGESETATRTFSVDLDEEVEPGLHMINMTTRYEDLSGNTYNEDLQIPLRVEGRPDLELADSDLSMKAGETSELNLKIENTGDQDAESVTARIIAERSQPFSLEDRSSYIGEIESGNQAEAVMQISADRSASLKQHNVKIQLRSNGDSEEGDTSVYTFTENTDISLEGRKRSSLIYIGVIGALLVIGSGIYRYTRKSEGGDQNE